MSTFGVYDSFLFSIDYYTWLNDEAKSKGRDLSIYTLSDILTKREVLVDGDYEMKK